MSAITAFSAPDRLPPLCPASETEKKKSLRFGTYTGRFVLPNMSSHEQLILFLFAVRSGILFIMCVGFCHLLITRKEDSCSTFRATYLRFLCRMPATNPFPAVSSAVSLLRLLRRLVLEAELLSIVTPPVLASTKSNFLPFSYRSRATRALSSACSTHAQRLLLGGTLVVFLPVPFALGFARFAVVVTLSQALLGIDTKGCSLFRRTVVHLLNTDFKLTRIFASRTCVKYFSSL
jgi:hypothetical protein